MAWRAANSLLILHTQLKVGAPRAAPPGTSPNEWGLIGDAAHDPTSDHAPHDFAGWGSQIVTAADFPNRPDLGLDAHAVLDDIRRSQDSRVKYAISNGQMYSSYTSSLGVPAWTWRPYSGTDPHYNHGHLSVVGDARADGTQAWATLGSAQQEDEDMDLNEKAKLDALYNASDTAQLATSGDGKTNLKPFPVPLTALIKGIAARVDALAARPAGTVQLDPAQLDEALDRALSRLLARVAGGESGK